MTSLPDRLSLQARNSCPRQHADETTPPAGEGEIVAESPGEFRPLQEPLQHSAGGGADVDLQSAAANFEEPTRLDGKARQARRLLELLSFFNDLGRGATPAEIRDRFKWPQSSTSEFLAVLKEVGLVDRIPHSRLYTPTPLAACLGLNAQPNVVRSGFLQQAAESLAAQTGYDTAVIGKSGIDAQLCTWTRGSGINSAQLKTGMKIPLQQSAAGWLLLSTVEENSRRSILRRLNAEAAHSQKIDPNYALCRIAECSTSGDISGPSGFVSGVDLCAALVPDTGSGQPLALAVLVPASSGISTSSRATLRDALKLKLAR